MIYNLNLLKETEVYKNLLNFYKLKSEKETKDLDLDLDLDLFLPIVAKRIGALLPGGAVDLERAASFLVRQFRDGKFGKLSLD